VIISGYADILATQKHIDIAEMTGKKINGEKLYEEILNLCLG